MDASLTYILSVVLLVSMKPVLPVPTTSHHHQPLSTLTTTTINPDIVENTSITPNLDYYITTILPVFTDLITSTDVISPTKLVNRTDHDRGNLSFENLKDTNPTHGDFETTTMLGNVSTEAPGRSSADTDDVITLTRQTTSAFSVVPPEATQRETLPAQDESTGVMEWGTRAPQEDGNTDDTQGEGTPPPPPQGDVNTEKPDTGTENSATEHKEIVLVDGRVPTIPDQLVKCQCGAKEVLTKEGCQHYPGDTFVYVQSKMFKIKQVPVASLDVVVHEPDCKTDDGHREMNFTGEEFYLRQRGDLVLKESVGLLEGLRINNYCVSHYMDDGGHVTWGMKKACIPLPSVPRCCPPGEAIEGGVCHPARSPTLLTPPISADMFKGSISWPVINNHISTLNCTKDPMKSLPLEPKISVLMSVPTGMVHIWIPSVSYITRKFTYPNEFCVDARETSSGSVEYSANICYSDALEKHQKLCYGNTCVRKCCDYGQVMSSTLYRCIAFENSTFSPPFIAEPSSFRTIIGKPLCTPQTLEQNISIDARGRLFVREMVVQPADYCTDKFFDGKTKVEQGVLVCLAKLSEWDMARDIAFPVCQVISVVFLVLTVLCYCLVPVLLQRGGWYQLFHVLSLMLAYSSGFIQQQFGQTWDDPTCIAMAVVMQFGYLCTFFWLSVLCFEVWRKIKSLNKFLPASNIALWVYMLYAFGGPFVICTVTLCMQFFAPDDVVGLVKPHLAESRCWFPDTMATLVYFYGPIAFLFACNIAFISHTFWIYRQIESNAAMLRNLEGGKTGYEATKALRAVEHTYRRRDYVADFKQQFSLLVLMSTCWLTEVLSWKIPPPEMWAPTDILNTLQGFFVFIIFVANRSKRKHLKRKFPMVFVAVKIVTSVLVKVKGAFMYTDKNGKVLSPVDLLASRVGRKISTTSFVSNFSTISTSLTKVNSSTSSFHLSSAKKSETKRSSSFSDSEDSIVTLSHSPLTPSGSDCSDSPC